MKAPTLDELVLLPEPLALQRHFDARSYRTFRWLVVLAFFISLGALGASAKGHDPFGVVVCVLNALFCLTLFLLRGRDVFARNFRSILLAFLLAQLALMRLGISGQSDDRSVPFMFAAFLLIAFRMRVTQHLLLYVALWTAAVIPLAWLGLTRFPDPDRGWVIALASVGGVCFAMAAGLSQVERKRFLTIWRREHSRARERLRMREEIEYARKIQLSMLPQAAPQVSWIDLAAASLPATEVGGDYYEYFKLNDDQLVLVIGDVAGHGLASGLLLSGVRSCLYLLEEYLAAPVEILERLNHMVRRTTDKRTYMTLLFAVLDRREGTLTLVSAGHPPMLAYDRGRNAFEEVGEGAPPLGTFLKADYRTVHRPLAAGDLLVFYTDGLVEARNDNDQEYGDARLQRAIARAAGSRTAREIRDAVLGDLSNFKGDKEQIDDLTLVVVRIVR
ncbi:MAG: PP2C family protein-serine/threonine phosphatase [Thermoanaerobaculia bacterium]